MANENSAARGVHEFRLPDVGEGLVEAEIVSWKVKPGDAVQVNDVIVEIETAKSLVELPCPYAGVVADLLVSEGQVVPVGTPIIRVSDGGQAQAAQAEAGGGAEPAAGTETATGTGARAGTEAAGKPERTSVLVGYGARSGPTRRRPRKSAVPSQPAPSQQAPPQPALSRPAPPQPSPSRPAPQPAPARPAPQAEVARPETAPAGLRPTHPETSAAGPALAKPPVRKLAKDLGVDLHQVVPTGPEGTITREDVMAYAEAPTAPAPARPAAPTGPQERETRVPVRGVRRATAQAVSASAFTAPHVTEWVTIDITASMELLERMRTRLPRTDEQATVKLSPLVLVAKACCLALRSTPELNAVWDEAAGEIVLRHYVNLGIAVATQRGLLVPHIKDAERLPVPELASALAELVKTAREGRTPPGDMRGTTFTITNVGVFGVDGGTPILNAGETGILAFGAVRRRPWVVGGDAGRGGGYSGGDAGRGGGYSGGDAGRGGVGTEADGEERIVPRWVTTLSLSFDHRVVDGEQGSRFLTDVADILTDPGLALSMV